MATTYMMLCLQGGPEKPFGGVIMTAGGLVSCRRVGEHIQEMSLWLNSQRKYHAVGTPAKCLALYVFIPSGLVFFFTVCVAARKHINLTVVVPTPF